MSSQTNAPHVIFGTMGLGGDPHATGYGAEQIEEGRQAIETAARIGIGWLDTADVYRAGKSERVIGEVLARDSELRAHFRIQTKCGLYRGAPTDDDNAGYDFSARHIHEAVEASLERLRVDHVDRLLLHRPDPLFEPDEVAGAFERLHDEGLVREFGVSNMQPPLLELLRAALGEATPITANQLELSLRARGFVEAAINVRAEAQPGSDYQFGTVEYCVAHGIGVQAWSPLARGRYSGRAQTPAEREASQLVVSLARTHGTTPETIVLWWLTRHPAGIVPVVGTRDPGRLAACEDAVREPSGLTRAEWYELLTAARGVPVP